VSSVLRYNANRHQGLVGPDVFLSSATFSQMLLKKNPASYCSILKIVFWSIGPACKHMLPTCQGTQTIILLRSILNCVSPLGYLQKPCCSSSIPCCKVPFTTVSNYVRNPWVMLWCFVFICDPMNSICITLRTRVQPY
jgi:hypothetical protein